MIIQYDTRPDATIDEKLRSLINSIQLALGEHGINVSNTSISQSADISSLTTEINLIREMASSLFSTTSGLDARLTDAEGAITNINETIASLDARVTALEQQTP